PPVFHSCAIHTEFLAIAFGASENQLPTYDWDISRRCHSRTSEPNYCGLIFPPHSRHAGAGLTSLAAIWPNLAGECAALGHVLFNVHFIFGKAHRDEADETIHHPLADDGQWDGHDDGSFDRNGVRRDN